MTYHVLDNTRHINIVQSFQASFLNSEFPSLKLPCLREERSSKVPVRLQPEADTWDRDLGSIRIPNKSSTWPFSGHLFTSRESCAVPQLPRSEGKKKGKRDYEYFKETQIVCGPSWSHTLRKNKSFLVLKALRDLQGFQGWKQLRLVSHFNSAHVRFARQKGDTTFLIRMGLSLRDSGVTLLSFAWNRLESNKKGMATMWQHQQSKTRKNAAIKAWSPIRPSYAASALCWAICWWFFPKRLSRRGQPLWCLPAIAKTWCHLRCRFRLHEIPRASSGMPNVRVPRWRKSCWGAGTSTCASWQPPSEECRWCCTLPVRESSNLPSCKMQQRFQPHGFDQGSIFPATAYPGRHRRCLVLLSHLNSAVSIGSPSERLGCFQTQKSCSETTVPGG